MLSLSSDVWLCLALPVLWAVQTLPFNLFLGIVTAQSCFSLMFRAAFPPLLMSEWKQRDLSWSCRSRGREFGKSQAGCLSDLWAQLSPVPAPGSLRNNDSLARIFQVGYQFVLIKEHFILFVILLLYTAVRKTAQLSTPLCNVFQCYHLGSFIATFYIENGFYPTHTYIFFFTIYLFFSFEALWKMHL